MSGFTKNPCPKLLNMPRTMKDFVEDVGAALDALAKLGPKLNPRPTPDTLRISFVVKLVEPERLGNAIELPMIAPLRSVAGRDGSLLLPSDWEILHLISLNPQR